MYKIVISVILVILIIVGTQSLYILNQTQQSVELRFGKAMDQENTAGLKFKMPFIDQVKYFDNRLLDLNADPKEVIAADRKRLIVDAFAKYKIKDSLKFYQTLKNESSAKSKLNSVLESSLRQVLGSINLSVLLQEGERTKVMNDITDIVNKKTQAFGIEVSDVRIMRADLPSENSDAIYRRMQTEREREAKEFRAEGQEESQKITSIADKEKVVILAQARKTAEITKGNADATATKIYARSFGNDIEFYEFYKSLDAYKNSFAKEDTQILLSPNGKFFKHFYNK